jgi:hypothetical protein
MSREIVVGQTFSGRYLEKPISGIYFISPFYLFDFISHYSAVPITETEVNSNKLFYLGI